MDMDVCVCVCVFLSAVLVTRHIWLLSTTPSDNAGQWHHMLPYTEAQLEPCERFPCECPLLPR